MSSERTVLIDHLRDARRANRELKEQKLEVELVIAARTRNYFLNTQQRGMGLLSELETSVNELSGGLRGDDAELQEEFAQLGRRVAKVVAECKELGIPIPASILESFAAFQLQGGSGGGSSRSGSGSAAVSEEESGADVEAPPAAVAAVSAPAAASLICDSSSDESGDEVVLQPENLRMAAPAAAATVDMAQMLATVGVAQPAESTAASACADEYPDIIV